MKAETTDRIRIVGLDPTDPLHRAAMARLEARFTYDNPVYWDARRYRRPCRHIPRQIVLFEAAADGAVSVPRGARPDVVAALAGLPVTFVDRTVLPAASIPDLNGRLRDYQEAAVAAATMAREGVIQAPTGSGKTVVAAALAARLKTPTLILVHTSVLLEQTAERIRDFLGIEPGRVGGGSESWDTVTVAMVQTLLRRDLAPVRDRFGLVILDEAHHCPAETFKSVVQRFAARYRIGLTATPTRKDRLHPVLFDVVGPIMHRVAPRTLVAAGSIAPSEVVEVITGFKGVFRNNYGALINRLVRDPARNALILDAVVAHRGARALVLSERVRHCEALTAALVARGIPAEVLTGKMSRDARDAVLARFVEGRTEVLVSTPAMVGEGFDLPAIETVFLTVPNGNVAKTTQVLGRALRPHAGKLAGRIVDFVDAEVSLLANQYKRRARVYRGFGA
jgi:superfamily II DNA or RNA helicase